MVKCLPSECKAPSSDPSTTRKEKIASHRWNIKKANTSFVIMQGRGRSLLYSKTGKKIQ